MSEGIVKSSMNFNLKGMLQVDVKCSEGSWMKSGAAFVSAGAVAAATVAATLFWGSTFDISNLKTDRTKTGTF